MTGLDHTRDVIVEIATVVTDDELEIVAEGPDLEAVLLRYTNALLAMVSQTAACNRGHPVEQRLARWLLMSRDRVENDSFVLTQEFLATMLGVQRPSVSVAGAALQRAGLVTYSRGKITIVDGAGLEDASCECYEVVKDIFERSRKAG